MRRCPAAPAASRVSSCRRLLRPRNNASRMVQTSNQSLTGTEITRPPRHRAQDEPCAIAITSRMTMCLSQRRVRGLQRHVRERRPSERRAAARRPAPSPAPVRTAAHPSAGLGRQRARGDRPPRLQRVPPIGFAIGDVVEEIDGPGQRAENQKGRQRERDGGRVEQAAREDQRRENNEVLGPLFRPERDQTRSSAWTAPPPYR